MAKLILRRLVASLPGLLVLFALAFLLMRMGVGTAGREAVAFGTDQPVAGQLKLAAEHLFLRFDLGPSSSYRGLGVIDVIAPALPTSLATGGLAFLLILGIGGVLGTLAAFRRGSLVDRAGVGLVVLAQVVPGFVVAPFLVLVFTLLLRWLPGGGSVAAGPATLVMPVITLVLSHLPNITRITRLAMLDVLGSSHVLAARAKGLPPGRLFLLHVLRPALMPVISYAGTVPVALVSGMMFTDVSFSTGGLGLVFVNAAAAGDVPVVLAITFLSGVAIMAMTLVTDLVQALVDPRLRGRAVA